MNRAHKGRRLEHRSKHLLESLGYAVIRAAGSKGVFDLWACNATELLLVQCKAASHGASPAEREQMRAVVAPPCTRRVVHVWEPRKALPRVVEL